jgi:pantothenate kinase type III
VLTIDVGNSALGVGRWSGNDVDLVRFDDPVEAARHVDGPSSIISVSSARLEQLLDAMQPECRAVATLLQSVPVSLVDPSLALSTGQDRLAAALAVSPGPAIVIDAGTALTVDLVDAEGVFLGGFIAPGPRATLDGLTRAGSALPQVEPEPCSLEPGLDTASAMRAGVWGLLVGGTDSLVRAALRQLPGARLVATGGWARAWANATELSDVEIDELLVHRGIARWADQAATTAEAPPRTGAMLPPDASPPSS